MYRRFYRRNRTAARRKLVAPPSQCRHLVQPRASRTPAHARVHELARRTAARRPYTDLLYDQMT